MAAVEKVIIKVEVDADINDDLAAIEARFKALEKRCRSLNDACCKREKCIDDAGAGCKKLEDTAKGVKKLDKNTKDLDKSTDKASNRFRRFTNILGSFWRGLRKLVGMIWSFLKLMNKISFIALAAEIAIFTAALLAVKAALVTGRAAASVWQITMAGLSATAASVAAGLAVAAAAMRQYKEAQLIPVMGGGPQGAKSAAMLSRSFTAETRALYGAESMGAVTSSLATAGVKQGDAVASQLFNISGGDAKAAQTLAEEIASASRSGNTSDLINALKQASGFAEGSIAEGSSLESILATIGSGTGTADAYKNVAEDMGATFIGTIKTEFESIKAMFADAGTALLGPFQDAFRQIANIVRNDLLGIFQIVREFGPDSLAPSLVSFADAVSEFIRSNIVKHVSDISSTAEKLKSFFDKVGDWFKRTKDWFKSYEDAADVVVKMMKAIGGASKNGLFRSFADQIVDNAEKFIEFGSKIGDVLNAIKKGFAGGNAGFFGQLDTLSAVLTSIANNFLPNLFKVQSSFARLFEKLPEVIALVSDRLGPILVNIFDAFKPVVDELPTVFSGILTIMEYLEPLVVSIAKIVENVLKILSTDPSGAAEVGLGAAALGMLGWSGGRGGGRRRRGLGRKVTQFLKKPGVGMAAIGGVAAIGGAYNTYNDGMSVGSAVSTVGGAAMAGMAVGGPVGAAVGAALGGISLAVAAWARDNKLEETAREMGETFVSGIRAAFEGGEVTNGFTDEEHVIVSNLVDLGNAAASKLVMEQRGNVNYAPGTEAHDAELDRLSNDFVAELQAAGYAGDINLVSQGGRQAKLDALNELVDQLGSDPDTTDTQLEAYYRAEEAFNRFVDFDSAVYELPQVDFSSEEMKTYIEATLNSGFLNDWEDGAYASKNIDDIIQEFSESPHIFFSMVREQNEVFEAEQLRRRELAEAFEEIGEAVGAAGSEVAAFVAEMGISIQHAEDMNSLALQNLYALYHSPIVDLAQGFTVDLDSTKRGQEELIASMDSAYNTLITESLSGDGVSTETMENFLNAAANVHVAAGGPAATGTLNAITALKIGINEGHIDPSILQDYDLDALTTDQFQQMATTFAIPIRTLEAAFASGGVGGVEETLQNIGQERESARDALFITGNLDSRTLLERQQYFQSDDFKTAVASTLSEDQLEKFSGFTEGQFIQAFDWLESEGLLATVNRVVAGELGGDVAGIDLSDVNDPVAQQLGDVARILKEQPVPETNIYVDGVADDRDTGSAQIRVVWGTTIQRPWIPKNAT